MVFNKSVINNNKKNLIFLLLCLSMSCTFITSNMFKAVVITDSLLTAVNWQLASCSRDAPLDVSLTSTPH